jgi:hypothetical protein
MQLATRLDAQEDAKAPARDDEIESLGVEVAASQERHRAELEPVADHHAQQLLESRQRDVKASYLNTT